MVLAAVALSGSEPASCRPSNLERYAGLALAGRLADADDGGEAGSVRRFGLGAYSAVLLPMIGPALGMADDDGRSPSVGNHLGGKRLRCGLRTRAVR